MALIEPTEGEPSTSSGRQINRYAVWSLVSSAMLIAPLGAIFGVVALVQIRKGKGEGAALAGFGLLLSVVLLPAAAALLLTADPAVFDSCRALQHQAEGTLRVVRFLEQGYREREGRYGSLDEVGFTSMYGDSPYMYSIERIDTPTLGSGYRAVALGNAEMEGDRLEIVSGGDLVKVRDVCHGPAAPKP